jgi:phage terminase small subunit
MPALSNHKYELFAQALAKGECADAAYVSAGYRPNRGNASTLKANQSVINRVAELQARIALKVDLVVADVVEMLLEDRKLATECEQSGSAVSATLGIAKVLGMLKDKVEHSGPEGNPIEYRIAAVAEVEELFGPTPHLIEHHG